MECEICGKPAAVKALIEDSILHVCAGCAAFGKPVAAPPPIPKKSVPLEMPPAPVLSPGSALVVRKARERRGLTREQLAGLLREKASVIERIERGMRPDERLARKLEHVLAIKLFGPEEAPSRLAPENQPDVTLGDIANVSVKKRRRSP